MSTKKRGGASLSDIAEQAGVSISTISKVANGQPDVAAGTRSRVERLLAEHNYVPPKRRKSAPHERITFLTRTMNSPLTLDVLRGAAAEAQASDVDLMVSVHPDDTDLRWIDDLVGDGRTAVVAVRPTLDEAQRARFRLLGTPLIVVDPYNPPDEGSFSVGATNWAGGLEAVEHLIAAGHRRIGMLTGVSDTQSSLARQHGYLAALGAHGIPVEQDLIRYGEFTYESGLADGAALLGLHDPPTAIFAASDFQAAGVIEAARRQGVHVPEDLSIIGFDDQIVARMTAPQLTSVRQPSEEMGKQAVRIARQLLLAEEPMAHHTELATTLVVRDSVAPPKFR